MSAKKKYKSDAFEAIHSLASSLHKVGAINKTTMRAFDASCIATPPVLTVNEQAERQQRVDFARGNVQLEEFTLDAEMECLIERYVKGEIDGDELVQLSLSSIQ